MNSILTSIGINLFSHLDVMNINLPRYHLNHTVIPDLPSTLSYTYAGLFNSGLSSGENLLSHLPESKFLLNILTSSNEIVSSNAMKKLLKQYCNNCDLSILEKNLGIGHMDILLNPKVVDIIQNFMKSHIPIMMKPQDYI